MGTSSGGGCCDCGDVEAWKRDPYCDEHNVCFERLARITSKKIIILLSTFRLRKRRLKVAL